MKKILVLAGSNSRTSINHKLANYLASQIKEVKKDVVFWDEIDLPLYSPQLEEESGIPKSVREFKKRINDADGIILSLAEHNSMPTAAFKNLWDWCSRIEKSVWGDKPMFLAATSPGGRGASSVLKIINDLMPHYGGKVIETFSLPKFYDNFNPEGLKDAELAIELNEKINSFSKSINN